MTDLSQTVRADDDIMPRIHQIRRDVRLTDARPNDGRCGNVAAALHDEFGWTRQCGYLRLLDGSVSWVHCWNRDDAGGIIDATADQFGQLWLGDVVALDASDAFGQHYLPNPRDWILRPEPAGQRPTRLLCVSGEDDHIIVARDPDHPWTSLAREALRLVTGWDLDDRLIDLAARALRSRLLTSEEASTSHLVRPLLTESIRQAGRTQTDPWIAAEFLEPL